jgi:hypothetical protein
MSRSQWGGQRSNQRGRPPLPEHKKRVRVATLLAPGSLEIAKAVAKELGLPGWGYAVDLALTTLEWLIKENEDLKNSLTGENYESQQK